MPKGTVAAFVEIMTRGVVPLLLIAAAGLKGSDLRIVRTETTGAAMPFLSLDVALITGELLLAVWLMSGLSSRLARGLAAVVFGCFMAVASTKVWMGEESCGCFGSMRMPPMITLVGDTFVATILVCSVVVHRVQSVRLVESRGPTFLRFVVSLLFGIGLFVSMPTLASHARGQWSSATSGEAQVVVGKSLPYLDQFTASADLSKGVWVVFFVRSGCPDCRQVLLDLNSEVTDPDSPLARLQGAVINVSSSASSTPLIADLVPESENIQVGPHSVVAPALPTPLICVIESGRVVLKSDHPVDLRGFCDEIRAYRPRLMADRLREPSIRSLESSQ